jgi:hypothetical protein
MLVGAGSAPQAVATHNMSTAATKRLGIKTPDGTSSDRGLVSANVTRWLAALGLEVARQPSERDDASSAASVFGGLIRDKCEGPNVVGASEA